MIKKEGPWKVYYPVVLNLERSFKKQEVDLEGYFSEVVIPEELSRIMRCVDPLQELSKLSTKKEKRLFLCEFISCFVEDCLSVKKDLDAALLEKKMVALREVTENNVVIVDKICLN